jgi:hypothetical protein
MIKSPAVVWVSFCSRCGEPWCASITRRDALHSSGTCDCPGLSTVAVRRYVAVRELAPTPRKAKGS